MNTFTGVLPCLARGNDRSFQKSELLANHSFEAPNGSKITIWKRGRSWIARGRFNRKSFGQTLGKSEREAVGNLTRLLFELGEGTFVAPSERRKQIVRPRVTESLETRDLVNRYLQYVRNTKGEGAKKAYLDRLRPVLQFDDLPDNRRRWPRVSSIDVAFVTEYLTWLRGTPIKNKRGEESFRKEKTIRNCLESLRGCLNWAKRPENRYLPGDYVMPVTQEILGKEASKDPFRPNPLSEEEKIKIVEAATDFELLVIGLFILLADRADELAGLCIEDVDLERRHLLFGINNSDVNFTKGHTVFRIPYQQALDGLMGRLIAGRCQGPLIRQISCQNQGEDQAVDLVAGWQAEATKNPSKVRTPNDKKALFRKVMRKSGGASADYIGKLFAKVAKKAGLQGIQPGFCRDSATHLMERSGMSHLSLRYLTSHSTSDILNTYTGLDIDAEMSKYYAMVPTLVQTIASRFPVLPVEPVVGEEIL